MVLDRYSISKYLRPGLIFFMIFHLCHALRMAEDLYCTVQRRCLSLTSCCVLRINLVRSWGEHCLFLLCALNLFEQLVEKGELHLCILTLACCSVLFLIKCQKRKRFLVTFCIHMKWELQAACHCQLNSSKQWSYYI